IFPTARALSITVPRATTTVPAVFLAPSAWDFWTMMTVPAPAMAVSVPSTHHARLLIKKAPRYEEPYGRVPGKFRGLTPAGPVGLVDQLADDILGRPAGRLGREIDHDPVPEHRVGDALHVIQVG